MWQGKMVYESTHQGNGNVARKQEATHRARLSNGEVGIRERTVAPTLTEFCKDRIEPYAKHRSSWIWFRAGIRALLKHGAIAGLPLDEIRGENAAGFAAWRLADGLKPSSINSAPRVLRRILTLAKEWGSDRQHP
jgi:hypothetical protein